MEMRLETLFRRGEHVPVTQVAESGRCENTSAAARSPGGGGTDCRELHGREGLPRWQRGDEGRRSRPGGRVLPDRGAGRPGQRRTTRSRSSARCWPPRARTSTRRRSSRSRISSRRRAASTGSPSEYDPTNRQAAAKVVDARSDDPRADRGGAAAARRSSSCASARAASAPTDAEPGLARAAEPPVQQRQHPRHPRTRSGTRPASTSPTTRRCRRPPSPCSSTASRSSRRCSRSCR